MSTKNHNQDDANDDDVRAGHNQHQPNNESQQHENNDNNVVVNASSSSSTQNNKKRPLQSDESTGTSTKPSSSSSSSSSTTTTSRPTKQAKKQQQQQQQQEEEKEEEVFQLLDVNQWLRHRDNHRQRHVVKEPKEVTCYSIISSASSPDTTVTQGGGGGGPPTKTIKYGSREQLKRYKKPIISSSSSRSNNNNNNNNCIDLSEMIEQWIPDDDDKPIVETILDALDESRQQSSSGAAADVITFRNNLNKIGGTVFNPRNDWEMECTLHHPQNHDSSTLYLDVLPTSSTQQQQREQPPPSKDSLQYKLQYYGYRFESVCTGMESQPVNCNNEFCSVVSLQIGTKRILMAAEIDCTTTGDHPKQQQQQQQQQQQKPQSTKSANANTVRDYVELKTMRGPLPPPNRRRDNNNQQREYNSMYRYRYPKYWLQSYLAGIPTIVIGERTDEGILVNIRQVQTTQMYNEAMSYFRGDSRKCGWNPTTIINFIFDVLEICRQKLCNNNNFRTLHVQYKSQSRQIVGCFRKENEEGKSSSSSSSSSSSDKSNINCCIGKRLSQRWQSKKKKRMTTPPPRTTTTTTNEQK